MSFDQFKPTAPDTWHKIAKKTVEIGFDMPSDLAAGALLRLLASSKPGGHFLELGTGTGLATAFLLDGMSANARLISVDNDKRCQTVAIEMLGDDPRVSFHLEDGVSFISRQNEETFDLIFADSWPGKYECLEETLALVKVGGFYIGDDMLPQSNWPQGHGPKAQTLLENILSMQGWSSLALDWGTGFVIAVKTGIASR